MDDHAIRNVMAPDNKATHWVFRRSDLKQLVVQDEGFSHPRQSWGGQAEWLLIANAADGLLQSARRRRHARKLCYSQPWLPKLSKGMTSLPF